MKIDDIFLKNYPLLDLHGEDMMSAKMMVNDFILENSILGNTTILVMHGVGSGALKTACHEALKENKMVKSFKSDNFNPGLTIIELNI